jgi:hypothetical protein
MVGLNLALIPSLRMNGAALALIGAYGVNIAMNLWYYRSFRRNAVAEEAGV